MRVGGIGVLGVGAEFGAGQGLGHGQNAAAGGGEAGEHFLHPALQPMAVQHHQICGEEFGGIGAGGAEEVGVHPLTHQAFHPRGGAGQGAYGIRQHGGGGDDGGQPGLCQRWCWEQERGQGAPGDA
jgi:hypothetical protein